MDLPQSGKRHLDREPELAARASEVFSNKPGRESWRAQLRPDAVPSPTMVAARRSRRYFAAASFAARSEPFLPSLCDGYLVATSL
jgi:hypothetical protein